MKLRNEQLSTRRYCMMYYETTTVDRRVDTPLCQSSRPVV